MIEPEDIAVLVLAAGLSRRFGTADKLVEPLRGKPLALHIGETLAAIPFAHRLAVCKPDDDPTAAGLAKLGFSILVNPTPEAGQGTSLAIGAKAAMDLDIPALLVCLGDMPNVTGTDLKAAIDSWLDDPPRPAASHAGDYLGPPAIFPAAMLPDLAKLSGDRGARGLLKDAIAVEIEPSHLKDFDLPGDFG